MLFFMAGIFAFFASKAFCDESFRPFTEEEDKFIQEIFDFRLSLRKCSNADECIKEISEFRNSNRDKINSFSEEAQITCLNALATAEYNAEYEKDVSSPNMEKILRPQFEKIQAFSEGKNVEELNPMFVLTSADITNSMMQFLPRSASITFGLKEKKDYEDILEKNPKMSFALTLSAWWHYYAPQIGGGSVHKAGELFESAQKFALSAFDKFYSNINLAQFYFEQKKYDLCEKYMSIAEEILPNTRYAAFLKKINGIGYSLFDFNMNSRREKIEKKLNEI